jgi:hypothetical protein
LVRRIRKLLLLAATPELQQKGIRVAAWHPGASRRAAARS